MTDQSLTEKLATVSDERTFLLFAKGYCKIGCFVPIQPNPQLSLAENGKIIQLKTFLKDQSLGARIPTSALNLSYLQRVRGSDSPLFSGQDAVMSSGKRQQEK